MIEEAIRLFVGQGMPFLTQWWKYVIDRRMHGRDNPHVFDVRDISKFCGGTFEPGYLAGMLKGLIYLLSVREEKLTSEMLIRMHDICIAGVTVKKLGLSPEVFSRGTVKNSEHIPRFGVSRRNRNLTLAGIEELYSESDYPKTYRAYPLEKWRESDPLSLEEAKALYNNSKAFFIVSPVVGEALLAIINESIDLFYARIERAETQDEKLFEICKFITFLERTHPFCDGNSRTLAILVLNKLLLEFGFEYCLLHDPNVFDGYGCDELVREVKTGLEYNKDGLPTLDSLYDLFIQHLNSKWSFSPAEIIISDDSRQATIKQDSFARTISLTEYDRVYISDAISRDDLASALQSPRTHSRQPLLTLGYYCSYIPDVIVGTVVEVPDHSEDVTKRREDSTPFASTAAATSAGAGAVFVIEHYK